MGIVHQATLTPSKQGIVAGLLPSRGWARDRTIAEKVAEYRLDDPEGEVGVETILWRLDDDTVVQVPLDLSRGAADRGRGAPDHDDAALRAR